MKRLWQAASDELLVALRIDIHALEDIGIDVLGGS
jgi:hypothetical protein